MPLLNDAVRGQTARLIHELLQPRLKMTQAVEGDHETILPGPAQLHHTLDVESDGTFWRYPTKITDFRDNDSVFFWEKWWVYQGLPVDRMGSNQRKKWDLTTENIWGVHPPIGDNGDDGVSLPLWRWLGYISQRYPGDLWCERRLLLSSDP